MMTNTNLANKIVACLIGFTILVVAALYVSVDSMRAAMNSQAHSMSVHSVETRMNMLHDKIRMMARDYNNWADVYRALQEGDINFVADNYAITAIYGEMFNAVTMFDGALKEPISWVENGDRAPTRSIFPSNVLSQIRERVKPLDITSRETLDFYMMIDGHLNFVSASYVLPDTTDLLRSISQDNLSIAALARKLRTREIRDMERNLQISAVRIQEQSGSENPLVPLIGVDGSPAAYISWVPTRAGDLLVDKMLPILIGTVIVFLGMAAFGTLAVYRHAKELQRREEIATALARIDSHTGLANRLAFNEHLSAVISSIPGTLAVLVIDLNGFKRINDMIGHQGGDQVLNLVAKSLAKLKRESCFIARLGGDEFAVVLLEPHSMVSKIEELSRQIIAELRTPIELLGYSFEINAAQGAAINNAGELSAQELLRRADYAMYYAKQQKASRIRIYSEKMERVSQLDRQIEIALRASLECPSEFSILFQPIVAAKDRKFVRAEALARWESKSLGQISPDKFIRVAEETELIIPLGWLLIRAICRDIKDHPGLSVSINVSPIQLMEEDFVNELLRVLAESEVAPRRIEIEITESVMILNAEIIRQRLRELRLSGIGIALDDFGTGFSSFGALRALPFDTLKIDRTLVDGASESSENIALVHSVVMLGRSLGIIIVGEGVETEDSAEFLSRTGCDLLQGHLFGKPMHIGDLVTCFVLETPLATVNSFGAGVRLSNVA